MTFGRFRSLDLLSQFLITGQEPEEEIPQSTIPSDPSRPPLVRPILQKKTTTEQAPVLNDEDERIALEDAGEPHDRAVETSARDQLRGVLPKREGFVDPEVEAEANRKIQLQIDEKKTRLAELRQTIRTETPKQKKAREKLAETIKGAELKQRISRDEKRLEIAQRQMTGLLLSIKTTRDPLRERALRRRLAEFVDRFNVRSEQRGLRRELRFSRPAPQLTNLDQLRRALIVPRRLPTPTAAVPRTRREIAQRGTAEQIRAYVAAAGLSARENIAFERLAESREAKGLSFEDKLRLRAEQATKVRKEKRELEAQEEKVELARKEIEKKEKRAFEKARFGERRTERWEREDRIAKAKQTKADSKLAAAKTEKQRIEAKKDLRVARGDRLKQLNARRDFVADRISDVQTKLSRAQREFDRLDQIRITKEPVPAEVNKRHAELGGQIEDLDNEITILQTTRKGISEKISGAFIGGKVLTKEVVDAAKRQAGGDREETKRVLRAQGYRVE